MSTTTRVDLRISLMAVILLLVFGATIETPSMISQTDTAISRVRQLLLRDAWVHNVQLGRIATESYVLVFRKTGELSETIIDDNAFQGSETA